MAPAPGYKVGFVHRKVPGRVRCHVRGLAGDEGLKKLLEGCLDGREGIISVCASLVTGNILILFSPAYSPESLAALIEDCLDGDRPSSSRDAATSQSGPAQSRLPERIYLEARRLSAGLRDKVTALFPGRQAQEEMPWHSLDLDTVCDALETDGAFGLTGPKAKDRIARYGFNALPPPQARSRWSMFVHQFISLPVALLGAAAVLSVFTGGLLDAAIIVSVVVANATVGYVTESGAERTIESLRNLLKPTATVIRDGFSHEIRAEELVIGDVILLKQGSYVPADARILEASHLTVDESALTGESMPAQKGSRVLRKENIPLSERSNMVYMSTLVTGGQCVAVVVATGSFTQMGVLQSLLQETNSPETPIERQLRQMGDHLVIICISICGLVFVAGILRGYALMEMLKISVSLAAAAVPEGLPAAATVNFALGIGRMRSHGVLIRRLQAVETLGAVQTLCLDKTGTITCNRMTVVECFAGMKNLALRKGRFYLEEKQVNPADLEELKTMAEVSALCNEAREGAGDTVECNVSSGSPTEIALLSFASAAGVDVGSIRSEKRLLKTNHRSENRLFMSTFHALPDSRRLFCLKGSPLEVLALCDRHMVKGEYLPLMEDDRLAIEIENDRMAGDMLRVLGLAYRILSEDDQIGEDEPELVWLGLVAMVDPVREGVEDLIAVFHRAGIDTVMITGDQSATAHAVAKRLNLSRGKPIEILDSSNLVSMDPSLMGALARKVHVYARVSPAHKLNVVRALQDAGRVVAMTGDGINDSPALKAADIGISMGRSGTDLAREVSDVVLEEDDLKTLVLALEDGRTIHANIKKSVHFFLSTNFSEIAVMFGSMAVGIGAPLNVMQLLWINLISDILPGLALSLEPPENDVLNRPPLDPGQPLFSGREYAAMVRESTVIAAASMAGYAFGASLYGLGQRAGTIAFQSLVIAQLLHALSCRSERRTLMNGSAAPSNSYLTIALGGSLALQALTIIVPGLRGFLGLTPLGLLDVAVSAGAAIASLSVNELLKIQTR